MPPTCALRTRANWPGVYPALVMGGLRTFQSLDVMRFLDHRMPVTTGRLDARFQSEVQTNVLSRHEAGGYQTSRRL